MSSAWQGVGLFLLMALGPMEFTACVPRDSGKAATGAVEQFRLDYEAARYNEIYARSTTAFRERVAEKEFCTFMSNMRERLGAVKQTRLMEQQTDYGLSDATVILRYETEFAKGRASEQFAWMIRRNQVSLRNYTLNVSGF